MRLLCSIGKSLFKKLLTLSVLKEESESGNNSQNRCEDTPPNTEPDPHRVRVKGRNIGRRNMNFFFRLRQQRLQLLEVPVGMFGKGFLFDLKRRNTAVRRTTCDQLRPKKREVVIDSFAAFRDVNKLESLKVQGVHMLGRAGDRYHMGNRMENKERRVMEEPEKRILRHLSHRTCPENHGVVGGVHAPQARLRPNPGNSPEVGTRQASGKLSTSGQILQVVLEMGNWGQKIFRIRNCNPGIGRGKLKVLIINLQGSINVTESIER